MDEEIEEEEQVGQSNNEQHLDDQFIFNQSELDEDDVDVLSTEVTETGEKGKDAGGRKLKEINLSETSNRKSVTERKNTKKNSGAINSNVGEKKLTKKKLPTFVDAVFKIPDNYKGLMKYCQTIESEDGSTVGVKIEGECEICKRRIRISPSCYFSWRRHLMSVHEIDVDKLPSTKETQKRKKNATVLDYFVPKKTKLARNDPKQLLYNKSCLDMICLDGHPYNFVEGPGYHYQMSVLAPEINIPSRHTLSRLLKEKVNEEVLPVFQLELSKIPPKCLHVSLDMWGCLGRKRIFGAKCHFIDDDWKSHSRTLGYSWFKGVHSGERIRHEVETLLKSRKIPDEKIGVIMADNASNITKAFNISEVINEPWDFFDQSVENIGLGASQPCNPPEKGISVEELNDDSSDEWEHISECSEDADMPTQENDEDIEDDYEIPAMFEGWTRLRCSSHTVQLAINDAIKHDKDVTDFDQYINSIITAFRKSPKKLEMLRDKCGKDLITYGVTRWNSIYYAAERLSESGVFIAAQQLLLQFHSIETSKKVAKLPQIPKMSQRTKMIDFVTVLKPLQILTDRMQSNSVTSSRLMISLDKAIHDLKSTTSTSFTIFRDTLVNNLKERFKDIVNQPAFVLSSILDPRLKLKAVQFMKEFPMVSEESAREMVRKELDQYFPREMTQTEDPQTDKRVDKEDDDLDYINSISAVSQSSVDVPSGELSKYLAEPAESRNIDPLNYWKINSLRFPGLAALARMFLSIPASSGDVERLFSITGNIKRLRRNRLKDEKVEQILLWKDLRRPDFLKQYPKLMMRRLRRRRPNRSRASRSSTGVGTSQH